MEQMAHEQSEQTVKFQIIQPMVEKPTDLQTRTPAKVERPSDLESNIVSRTLAKENETLPIKHNKEAAELPEKYTTLSEFFNRMTSSLRLLRLQKKSPTFQNICRQVEILSGRKFSYKHLAQIKFILPEAVQTERIMIHDEKTLCMKPDLKITLLLGIVKGHNEQSVYNLSEKIEQSGYDLSKKKEQYLALRVVFAARIFDFFSTHTESFEIPEAELPEPFNKRSISAIADSFSVNSSALSVQNPMEAKIVNPSHLHSTFRRHFDQKDLVPETEKAQLLDPPVPCSYQETGSDPQGTSPDACPIQLANPPCFSSGSCESTPTKFTLKLENLMVETPAQLTPQRSLPSCDVKLKTTPILERTPSCLSAKRTLEFSYPEDETKGIIVENKTASLDAPPQKDSSCFTSGDKVINQSGLTSTQQMSSCLPDLLVTVNNIFQNAKCPSITKEELVHKIIMNTLDIVERREVEEQIDLLEKLVPDWIGKKLTPSGDILYNIKKASDLKSVCERLICI